MMKRRYNGHERAIVYVLGSPRLALACLLDMVFAVMLPTTRNDLEYSANCRPSYLRCLEVGSGIPI